MPDRPVKIAPGTAVLSHGSAPNVSDRQNMDHSAAPDRPPQPPAPEFVYESTPWTSARSLKQMSIFCLGATCFLASTAITRRAIYRRNLRIKPKFYAPNTNPHEHFSPFHDALQALNLATMNCISVGIMLGGGALWSVDISGLGEMRSVLRSRLDYDTIYAEGSSGIAEESLEASVLRRREEGGGKNSPKSPR